MTSRRRAQPRVQANISVKVRVPDGQTTTTEQIRNISLGGVFIQMDDPLPFGAEVSLEFTLPVAPRTIRCRGFVVWSTKTSPERAPQVGDEEGKRTGLEGVGVRLMEIGITDMRLLAEYIEGQLGAT